MTTFWCVRCNYLTHCSTPARIDPETLNMKVYLASVHIHSNRARKVQRTFFLFPIYNSRQRQANSSRHRVQICSGAHLVSYPMSTGGSFRGGKAGGSVKLTTHLQLVPMLRMCGAITPLPHTDSGPDIYLSIEATLLWSLNIYILYTFPITISPKALSQHLLWRRVAVNVLVLILC
jgi:hypothetical protein